MGIPAANGLPLSDLCGGDKASQVETGVFSAEDEYPHHDDGSVQHRDLGLGQYGLTLSQGSLSASVASGTGLAAGSAVNSLKVPPGTTGRRSRERADAGAANEAIDGRTSVSIQQYGFPIIKDLNRTSSLTGATVTGPGIPASTTVVSVVQPYAGAGPLGRFNRHPPNFQYAYECGVSQGSAHGLFLRAHRLRYRHGNGFQCDLHRGWYHLFGLSADRALVRWRRDLDCRQLGRRRFAWRSFRPERR